MTGVEEKQFVIHLMTLFQNTVILSCIVALGGKQVLAVREDREEEAHCKVSVKIGRQARA